MGHIGVYLAIASIRVKGRIFVTIRALFTLDRTDRPVSGAMLRDRFSLGMSQRRLALKMWSHAVAGTLKTEMMQAESNSARWMAADHLLPQQRMRDLHAGAQHAIIQQSIWSGCRWPTRHDHRFAGSWFSRSSAFGMSVPDEIRT